MEKISVENYSKLINKLFELYQKGMISIDVIYEDFNLNIK